MIARLMHLFARVLLIPIAAPTPIPGATAISLLSSSRKVYAYALTKWLGAQLLVLSGVLMVLFVDELMAWSGAFFVLLKVLTTLEQDVLNVLPEYVRRLLVVGSIIGYVWQLIQSFFFLWLRPRTRWYLVTNQGIQIREGIWTISDTSIRFATIQDIALKQGALQHVFGLADIEVRTAGGHAKTEGNQSAGETTKIKSHIGVFRDVEDSEQIRDLIQFYLAPARNQALVDAGETQPDQGLSKTPQENELLPIAREMLTEVQALRQALSRAAQSATTRSPGPHS